MVLEEKIYLRLTFYIYISQTYTNKYLVYTIIIHFIYRMHSYLFMYMDLDKHIKERTIFTSAEHSPYPSQDN